MNQSKVVLVTGATGYIGGRLIPPLLEAGYQVRCLVRDARRIQGRPWTDQVEVVEGDALRPETLPAAMEGNSDYRPTSRKEVLLGSHCYHTTDWQILPLYGRFWCVSE